jgi:hypothetical protein
LEVDAAASATPKDAALISRSNVYVAEARDML